MTIYRLRPEAVRWRAIGEEVVAVDLGSSTYLSANPAGSLLWAELAGGATTEALAGRLVGAYAIDERRARRDAEGFVAELVERGLVEAVGRP